MSKREAKDAALSDCMRGGWGAEEEWIYDSHPMGVCSRAGRRVSKMESELAEMCLDVLQCFFVEFFCFLEEEKCCVVAMDKGREVLEAGEEVLSECGNVKGDYFHACRSRTAPFDSS